MLKPYVMCSGNGQRGLPFLCKPLERDPSQHFQVKMDRQTETDKVVEAGKETDIHTDILRSTYRQAENRHTLYNNISIFVSFFS